MAVGAHRAHTGAVGVVDGVLGVLLVDVVAHLVAGDAERLAVGVLDDGVETAPEDHARDHADKQQRQHGPG
jgi:hypothetical protein